MAVIYSEFDTTPATAAADIKTKILTSTDWASLTGTGLTSAVKATTPRGAQMVVDFADVAVTAIRMQMAVYRTHDGTTGVDKVNRFITVRDSGGATSDPWHVVVSAGPQHLYVSIEGPRNGETNVNLAATGSVKQSLYLGDITPYFGGDTIPAVCCIGASTSSRAAQDAFCWVSRNAADTVSWAPSYLSTVAPLTGNQIGVKCPTVVAAGDGNEYLYPWVVVEQGAGLRGRLTNAFYGGFSSTLVAGESGLSPGSRVSYSGSTYVAQVPHLYRSVNPGSTYHAWWWTNASSSTINDGPLVMVPMT